MENYSMIEIKEDEKGFQLFFKGRLFLEHDEKHPLIKLGKGTAIYFAFQKIGKKKFTFFKPIFLKKCKM